MYKNLSDNPEYFGKNLFYSPYSISSALTITQEGARGITADEIRKVFHLPSSDIGRREGFARVDTNYNHDTLQIANALWIEESFPLLPEFVDIAHRYYSAEVKNLDFKNSQDESRKMINTWVEEKTKHKIRDLLSPGAITPDTSLVITNAIYFKDTWEKMFDKGNEQDFRVEPGKIERVQMMQKINEMYNYTDTGDVQILEIPYNSKDNSRMSLYILLPKSDNLSYAEKVLASDTFPNSTRDMRSTKINVYIPKFRLETEYHLPPLLNKMGMKTAFTPDANFSGIIRNDGNHVLMISDIIHKAFIEVDEKGTEAAAATAVVEKVYTSAYHAYTEPLEFRVDHPFIFLVEEKPSGNILFIGRVINPA